MNVEKSSHQVYLQHVTSLNAVKFEQTRTPRLVSIEGNIASGKSEIMKILRELASSLFEIKENPVCPWRNGGFDYKTLFDLKPRRFAHLLSSVIIRNFATHYQTICQSIEQDDNMKLKVVKNSLLSIRYVFLERLHQNGFLNAEEMHFLRETIDQCMLRYWPLDIVIYVRTDSRVCFDRMKVKNSEHESGLLMADFEDTHVLYEQWLHGTNGFCKIDMIRPSYVFTLDGNRNLAALAEDCAALATFLASNF